MSTQTELNLLKSIEEYVDSIPFPEWPVSEEIFKEMENRWFILEGVSIWPFKHVQCDFDIQKLEEKIKSTYVKYDNWICDIIKKEYKNGARKIVSRIKEKINDPNLYFKFFDLDLDYLDDKDTVKLAFNRMPFIKIMYGFDEKYVHEYIEDFSLDILLFFDNEQLDEMLSFDVERILEELGKKND